jgi:multiple antibiotic resistance protein
MIAAHPMLGAIVQFSSVVMLAIGALFPIVDPLAGAPIFLAMTGGLSAAQRSALARSVAINSFLLLLASALIGAYVLDFFGLSIPAVQVAGGAVVCMIGWSLLNSPAAPAAQGRADAAATTPEDLEQRAFYPMTMPLTVGPGSISVAVTLGANPPAGLRPLLLTTLAHALGVLLVAVSVFLCYRYAERLVSRLGATGTSVVVRLSAFILLCIGVQIGWNGIRGLIQSAFPR